jgi:hypothetical protein
MRIGFVIAAVVLSAAPAFAQGMSQPGPQNPAVKSPSENNAMAPVAGANSFTRGQAISRIESKGYTHVKLLQKDASGVWRGTATKDGQSGPVSVDYQGNVN